MKKAKYIVVNGSFMPAENHASLVAVLDDLETAVACCNKNLAEDFGYGSYDEFLKKEFPVVSETFDTEYIVSYSMMEHEEVYKVYKAG